MSRKDDATKVVPWTAMCESYFHLFHGRYAVGRAIQHFKSRFRHSAQVPVRQNRRGVKIAW
jgi:hypothetical protein